MPKTKTQSRSGTKPPKATAPPAQPNPETMKAVSARKAAAPPAPPAPVAATAAKPARTAVVKPAKPKKPKATSASRGESANAAAPEEATTPRAASRPTGREAIDEAVPLSVEPPPVSRNGHTGGELPGEASNGAAPRAARAAAATPPATDDESAEARHARPEETEPAPGAGEPEPEAREEQPLPGWPPRDMLTPFVLLAVSMQRAHGYVIEEYLRALGVFGFTMSTLYRTLRQMERDGFLASSWEPGAGGPARRIYTLTDAGRMWLDASAAWLNAYRDTIDRFFGLYGSATRTEERDGRR